MLQKILTTNLNYIIILAIQIKLFLDLYLVKFSGTSLQNRSFRL